MFVVLRLFSFTLVITLYLVYFYISIEGVILLSTVVDMSAL